jgi:hypothetical protein
MLTSKSMPVIVIAAAFALNCASADKSTVLKDPQGKVIGRYDVMSDTDARASFDLNQNGISEKVSSYKDKKLVNVDYFDDKSGIKTKAVSLVDGKPTEVKVYDDKGKDVRGDATIDTATNSAKEVLLPAKNKKVVFNGDGTLSISTVEKK